MLQKGLNDSILFSSLIGVNFCLTLRKLDEAEACYKKAIEICPSMKMPLII